MQKKLLNVKLQDELWNNLCELFIVSKLKINEYMDSIIYPHLRSLVKALSQNEIRHSIKC